MKILFISNIANKGIGSFSLASIEAAKSNGFDFHIAANWDGVTEEQMTTDKIKHGVSIHQIDFIRNPLHPGNIKAYRQLVKLVRRESFDVIHCNTPVGGLLGRLAGMRCGVEKLIYQAHGFHFYDGAPLINWLVYYPIERWLAHYTDALIAINKEDYELARRKFKLRNNGKAYYVPGVGIDASIYQKELQNRRELRRSIGVSDDDIMLISMGDLIERKNYKTAISAISQAHDPKLKYCICGKGPELDKLKQLSIELGVDPQVDFLGFRSDIKDLLHAADIFLFSSKQEGLPRSLMEAMAAGIPCIVSSIRGNIDLIQDGVGGYLCDALDAVSFAERILELAANPEKRKAMGEANMQAIQQYDVSNVIKCMNAIYHSEILNAFGGM